MSGIDWILVGLIFFMGAGFTLIIGVALYALHNLKGRRNGNQ